MVILILFATITTINWKFYWGKTSPVEHNPRGCLVLTFCRQRRSSDEYVCTFGAENLFSEIYNSVSARTGGVGQCGHFVDKGEVESFFCDFVRTSFMDGPIIFETHW